MRALGRCEGGGRLCSGSSRVSTGHNPFLTSGASSRQVYPSRQRGFLHICTSVEYRKIHPPTITRESSRKASQRPLLSIFQVGKDQRFGEQTACAVETGGEEAEVVGTNSMGGSLWKHKHAFDFEVQVLFTCMSTSLAYKTEAWGWRDG